MPSICQLGLLLLVALAAAAAAEADAPASDPASNPTDSAASAATSADGAAAAVNTTAECLPGFERSQTGACFQPPTCFLPMVLSEDRTTCICPASDPEGKVYWGGFRVINGLCVCPPLETMTKAKTMTPYGCECRAPFERDHGHWGVCMCPKHLELSEDHKSCIERVNKIEIGIASEDEHIRKNRAQMHKFGRVASKTERLFRYDGPVIWGISNGGVTPEIQGLLDNYLSDIEHLKSISSEWSDFQKERYSVRSFDEPQGGFLPPGEAVEALGVSQQIDEEERLLLAAAAPTTTEEMHHKALMTTDSIPVILGVRRIHIHNEEDAIDRALESLDKNDEGSRQASGPWYGGWWIVIFGKNFGESKRGVAALIGGRPCLQTIWIGSQMLLCMVPRGPGGEADLKVVANGRVMNLMGAVAFELPKVTAIQPSNSPTFGGIFVTLSGEHFGFLDTSPNMGLASSGCEESHWISDSSMLCKIFPGVGGNLAVGINPGWTPHVQKVPQKAVAKAKLLIESRQQKRVLNIGGAAATRSDVVQTETDKQELDQKSAAAAEQERQVAAAAAAAAAAARAKALEDEKVKAYLDKKAAMDAAKASAPQVLQAVPLSIPEADAKPSQPQKQMEL